MQHINSELSLFVEEILHKYVLLSEGLRSVTVIYPSAFISQELGFLNDWEELSLGQRISQLALWPKQH